MRLIFIMLTTVLSCSTVSEEKKKLAWEQWQGHSVKTLTTHPYFKHLPIIKIKHNDAPDTWIFRDQSRFQSDSYCQSLSGCVAMPIYIVIMFSVSKTASSRGLNKMVHALG